MGIKLKIRNPKFVSRGRMDNRLNEFGPVIDQYVANLPEDVEMIDFDTIRADIVAMNLVDSNGEVVTADDITDGVLSLICERKKIQLVHEYVDDE